MNRIRLTPCFLSTNCSELLPHFTRHCPGCLLNLVIQIFHSYIISGHYNHNILLISILTGSVLTLNILVFNSSRNANFSENAKVLRSLHVTAQFTWRITNVTKGWQNYPRCLNSSCLRNPISIMKNPASHSNLRLKNPIFCAYVQKILSPFMRKHTSNTIVIVMSLSPGPSWHSKFWLPYLNRMARISSNCARFWQFLLDA